MSNRWAIVDPRMGYVREVLSFEPNEEMRKHFIVVENVGEDVTHEWKLVDGVLVPETVNIADAIEDKCSLIDKKRASLEANGVPWVFNEKHDVIQTRNEVDKSNIQMAVSDVQSDLVLGITDKLYPFKGRSNTVHQLSAEQMLALGKGVLTHIQSLQKMASAYKAKIRAMVSKPDVTRDEIYDMADWPN